MLQQTTVVTVKSYYLKFITLWPTVSDLASASDADVMAQWAGLGYYARARNLLKTARIVARDFSGVFPQTCQGLLELPGIGPYTAAAICSIAYDLPETVIDGNVERVMARLFSIKDPHPKALAKIKRHASALTPAVRPGDYAQAVMDLGATVCTPKSPRCDTCPLQTRCLAKREGLQSELPRKKDKPPKPTRRGLIYVARRTDGAWLLERRPEKGLLGGMLGWPGSQWGDKPQPAPPIESNWQVLTDPVSHTFTHFHLQLTVHVANPSLSVQPVSGSFIPANEFSRDSLPTLMRKVFDAANPSLQFN